MIENYKLKVTIMIPTYNQAAFICKAIDSALAQTYPNLEIIVGDDASKDATSTIAAKINDPRFKYVQNDVNLGRAANYRNLLYNHATGDYVVNLDGDDYYTDPDFITEAVKLIGYDQNVVIVAARSTQKKHNFELASEIPIYKSANGLEILAKLPNAKYLLQHMATLYARKPALDIDFYRSSVISSDWESLFRLSLRGEVKYLDRIVGVWRIHEKNESGTTNRLKHLENLDIWLAICNEAVGLGMNPIFAKFVSVKCIAYSAQWSCVKVSKNGNGELLKFIFSVAKAHKLAVLLFICTPKYLARFLLCIVGYYR